MKMKRKPNSECLITLLPPPAYHPHYLKIPISAFVFDFYENQRGSCSEADKKNDKKSCFLVFYHPGSPQNANFGYVSEKCTAGYDFWFGGGDYADHHPFQYVYTI